MSAAHELLGKTLSGKRGREWSVVEKVTPANDHTPGQFSVCYKVVDGDGKKAFLKASDLDLLTEGDDMLGRFTKAVNAYNFERLVLDHCRGSNMDRVVTALDYGECIQIVDGTREPLFYIIFELAEGDIRLQISMEKRFNLLWCVGALHHIAIAINQLHEGGICHNDIKPGNVLFFSEEVQKLADLGRATSETVSAPHDDKHDIGDPVYAPPEFIYPCDSETIKKLCETDCRRAGDLYQLGSIAFFLVSGKALTPAIVERLAPEHRPPSEEGGWTGGLQAVLPFWREAFSRAIDEVLVPMLPIHENGLITKVGNSVLTAILQLAEADRALRGHPLNFQGKQDRRGVERYITLFDSLRLQLSVRKNA